MPETIYEDSTPAGFAHILTLSWGAESGQFPTEPQARTAARQVVQGLQNILGNGCVQYRQQEDGYRVYVAYAEFRAKGG